MSELNIKQAFDNFSCSLFETGMKDAPTFCVRGVNSNIYLQSKDCNYLGSFICLKHRLTCGRDVKHFLVL